MLSGFDFEYWIGLTDRDVPGELRWEATGELTTWTNWASGEPNDKNGVEELCVYAMSMYGVAWADLHCISNGLLPLCEHAPWW